MSPQDALECHLETIQGQRQDGVQRNEAHPRTHGHRQGTTRRCICNNRSPNRRTTVFRKGGGGVPHALGAWHWPPLCDMCLNSCCSCIGSCPTAPDITATSCPSKARCSARIWLQSRERMEIHELSHRTKLLYGVLHEQLLTKTPGSPLFKA